MKLDPGVHKQVEKTREEWKDYHRVEDTCIVLILNDPALQKLWNKENLE